MTEVFGLPLPAHWTVSPLKRATPLLNRGSAPDYVEAGPVVALSQASNQDAGIDWSRTRFHSFCGDPSKLKGYLKSEDIIINSTGTGTLGRVGYFRGSPNNTPCIADSHITIARFSPDIVYPRFGYYWLRSEPFQRHILSALVVGATNQIELNSERLARAPIPLPPLEEQRRIADFLDAETDRVDGMQLRTRSQVILLSERLNESIRLATTTGNGPRRETGIAWMPEMNEQWQLFKVSHAFRSGSGTTPTSDRPEYYGGPYPWVNSADINDGQIEECDKSVTAAALTDFPALKIHPAGSLVVALYGQGATKGKVGILRIDACLNQACCVLIPTGPIAEDYAAYWFRAHKQGIVGLALGAGQPNLSQELIRQLRIPAPDRPAQNKIVTALRKLEDEVRNESTLLRARERLLSERRTALITAAVSGQVDVSTASGRGIED
ncbi:restriction endonuclease subunit S [Micromonospora sp. NPDC047707]|uniref:restriction endonuclease subunit S n=1 Tax=Micromonospora sp. NPDC047707 TaxID=3154498 RepID=UPI003451B458